MQRYLDITTATLEEALSMYVRPRELADAMRHAIMAGGKRIRPVICLAAAEAVGGSAEDARYAAAAIELLHNYTLVHDDLPSMDNDTLRRGKPTVWAKYGESTAILAGDALQALAFQLLAKTKEKRRKGISHLSPPASASRVPTFCSLALSSCNLYVPGILRSPHVPTTIQPVPRRS
jgi:geranylgeranyl pyrophosphate synthase